MAKYLIKTILIPDNVKDRADHLRETDWLLVDPDKTFTINIFDKTYIQAVRCKDCRFMKEVPQGDDPDDALIICTNAGNKGMPPRATENFGCTYGIEKESEPPLFKAAKETKQRIVNAFMGRKDEVSND